MTSIEFLTPSAPRTFDDEAAWYEEASVTHFWFRWRMDAISRMLSRHGVPWDVPLRSLDVGCGTGVLIRQIQSRSHWEIDGADLNQDALERVRCDPGRVLFYDIEQRDPRLKDSYDVIFLCDVIEHVPDPRALLGAALWHLRPGGILLINVPALQRFHGAYDDAVGHLRRYDGPSLRTDIEGAGGIVIDTTYWGFLMLPMLVARWAAFRSDEVSIRRGLTPPNRGVEAVLNLARRCERAVGSRFPLGTSILALASRS